MHTTEQINNLTDLNDYRAERNVLAMQLSRLVELIKRGDERLIAEQADTAQEILTLLVA